MKSIIGFLLIAALGCSSETKVSTEPGHLTKSPRRDSAKIDTSCQSLSLYKGDTTRYLHDNFVEKSDFYRGQSVSSLFDILELPIISAIPFPISSDREKVNGINVSFHKDVVVDHFIDSKKNPGTIVILFNEFLPRNQLFANRKLSRADQLTQHLRLYRNLTIKKIDSVRYNFNKVPPTPEEIIAAENMPKIN